MEYEHNLTPGSDGDITKPRVDFRGNPMPDEAPHEEYNGGGGPRGDFGSYEGGYGPDDGYGGEGNYNSEHDDPMDGGYGRGGYGGRGGPYRGGFRGRGILPGRGFPPGRGGPGPYNGHGYYPPGHGGPPPMEDKDTRLRRLAGCVEGEELWVEADAGKITTTIPLHVIPSGKSH